MKKQDELLKYEKSNEDIDEEIDRRIQLLRDTIRKHYEMIDGKVKRSWSDKEVYDLTGYLRKFTRRHYDREDEIKADVSIDKIKAFLLLFTKVADGDHADNIRSYLESTEYGWHENVYYLDNPCLRSSCYSSKEYCKRVSRISDSEYAVNLLYEVNKIFFKNDFSSIVLFIFNYCLASVFSSMLNSGGVSMPFYLQIALDKSSVAYQILKEIVEICDVNSGLMEKCNNRDYVYGQCNYARQIYYPTQSVATDIENIIHDFKDRPVLIIGHENERYYNALLREVANIPTKRRALGLRDRFNLLPIFVCPAIKSSFDNVFDMDLTDVEVSEEHLTLIRRRKQILASWVLELVTDRYEYNLQKIVEETDTRWSTQSLKPISRATNFYRDRVCQKYPHLTLDNARNVGYLTFFFKSYLNTFQQLCTFSGNDEVIDSSEPDAPQFRIDINKAIEALTINAESSLARLHHKYLPAPAGEGIQNKEAKQLAKQIEKHYRALKVYIRATPTDVKDDRTIFTIETLNNTKDTDVSKNTETVQRRLKKYEYFRVDLRDKISIKLIVAEKPLSDNSLIEILKHKDFADKKRKIPYAVGYEDTGDMCIVDIKEFPHLLLGGTTQSGKSTAMISLLMSIAYMHRTGNVNVLIIDLLDKVDSKFNMFNGQPFMSAPVITELDMARRAILALHKEKMRRLKDCHLNELPYIVCVIDEFPSLYSDITKEVAEQVKAAIDDLLARGVHTGIHLVLAAQDPLRESMKGSIANIANRIAFKCSHYQNSVTIIGRAGAEKLVGYGQMIFDTKFERDKRLQGSFISTEDAKTLLSDIAKTFKQENKFPYRFDPQNTAQVSTEPNDRTFCFSQRSRYQSDDDILLDAIMWTLPQNKVANSRLQKQCKIGNDKANSVLDRMEGMGLIQRLHGNLGWKTVPRCFDDIPQEVIEHLKKHGKTEDQIRNVFIKVLKK